MFNFIKEKISEMNPSNDNIMNDEETVLEYAHLFQELDDLSMTGSVENESRPMDIEIPLEDDIEIESIELNLSDGRVTDIPMDATVQESNYDAMKTFDDFYQEACKITPAFQRDSIDNLEKRRIDNASKNYEKYKNRIIQEGLFGFDKLNIDDERLPGKIMIDFGPMSEDNSNHYTVKMEILYEVDKKQKVMKKQLESINVATTYDVFLSLSKVVENYLRTEYADKMKDVKCLWDVLTPIKFIVPIEPMDKYAITIGFDCDFVEEMIYYTWHKDIKSKNKAKNKYNKDEFQNPKCFGKISNNIVEKVNYKSKGGFTRSKFVNESYDIPKRFTPSRFYQEAIDFGDGGDPSTPPENIDNNQEPIVSVDNNDQSSSKTAPDEDATPVDTNNVSEKIAQKVSDEDNNDVDSAVTDIPIENNFNVDDSPNDENIDDKLKDLDDMGNTDMGLDESAENIDVDNMTIEELLEQGSEKLKGMTIQQLKTFLSSADESQIQEAFILTKKNINKEIYIRIKNALGILNNSDMDITSLMDSFKKAGKSLNKALSKASKQKKDYSEDEIKEIIKLNKCLIDLMTVIGNGNDKSYITTIKQLIKYFTSQCVAVSKIVEEKNN